MSKYLLALAIPMSLLAACAQQDSGTPGGGGDGKADDTVLSECQRKAITDFVNDTASLPQLTAAGLSDEAAAKLIEYVQGADGARGTADDGKFENADEVAAKAELDQDELRAIADASGASCAADDGYAQARDVTLAKINLGDLAAPTSYTRAATTDVSLGGTEFWQRWSGGHSPTFAFTEGTDFGRRCMQASAIRFETIMKQAPESIKKLKETTNWGGSFFNWNDDYSQADYGDASGSRLWAWRTGLIKWISQTAKDGSCYLPTLEMVERLAVSCQSTAASSNGEIQGCSAR